MKRNTILIVEDMEINRMMLAEIFKDEYSILEAENGEEGLRLLTENVDSIAAVLLDVIMPVMDGFQVLDHLRSQDLISKIPIIMITGETSVEYERRGYEYGVVEYIHKPYHAPVVRQMVKNNIDLYAYKTRLESMVKLQTAELEEQNELLKQQAEKLSRVNDAMIDAMSNIVEFRNMESGLHVKRIRIFTRALAEDIMVRFPEYELTPHRTEVISKAAAMHDIGKITVPDHVLLKPGRLTPEEFEIIKQHTSRGAEMIASFVHLEDEEYYNYCYDICRHHHERYDGRGYPDGLKGDEIDIAAQMVSLADVFDALVAKRVYKQPFEKEKAFQMIVNGECGCFSPKLLEAFSAVKEKFFSLADTYSELEDDMKSTAEN